mmetsp:Transcript_11895/g.32538  ORF Transcript_11895/g.32538 Transcript_11895/m.32538 type:complete len:261 (+) Transcript_11895:227-1009(+)
MAAHGLACSIPLPLTEEPPASVDHPLYGALALLLWGDFVVAGLLHEAGGDADPERCDDDGQGEPRADLDPGNLAHQLEPNKPEDYGHRLLQVDEVLHGDREDLVETPQAQDRSDVGREDDHRIVRHRKDCRHGIHRKQDVAELDGQYAEREGCHKPPPGILDDKLVTDKGLRGWKRTEDVFDDLRRALVVVLVLLVPIDDGGVGGIQQDAGKDQEHRLEAVDRRKAQEYEQGAQDHSSVYAQVQATLLEAGGYLEVLEYD